MTQVIKWSDVLGPRREPKDWTKHFQEIGERREATIALRDGTADMVVLGDRLIGWGMDEKRNKLAKRPVRENKKACLHEKKMYQGGGWRTTTCYSCGYQKNESMVSIAK